MREEFPSGKLMLHKAGGQTYWLSNDVEREGRKEIVDQKIDKRAFSGTTSAPNMSFL